MDNKSVFVFGTNLAGFHGAGSAGYAMFGVRGNVWRTMLIPGTTLSLSSASNGTKGLRAVKGQAQGLMVGSIGLGYGIATIRRPGQRRSVSQGFILEQLRVLSAFARQHPELTFHLSAIGTGYSGFTVAEMDRLHQLAHYPSNIVMCNNFDIHNT